jgi:hypothetical protein
MHARLSPSQSGIWMTCPGAIPLIEKLGLRGTGTSIYADMGTAMHAVAERCLRDDLEVSGKWVGEEIEVGPASTVTITDEMIPIIAMFVDYVRSLPDNTYKAYELRVTPFAEHKIFGTADNVSIYEDDQNSMVLEIVDLKSGRTLVDVVKNTQLMIYAIGAYKELGTVFNVQRFRITIVQPIVGPPQSYEFDLEELLDFEQEVLKAIKRVKTEPNTFVPSEKACRWCDARAVCPAQQLLINELAAKDFKDLKSESTTDFGDLYRKSQIAKIAIKAIEEESLKRLVAGQKVSGFRLAPGSTRRSWGDTESLIADLSILVGRKRLSEVLDEPSTIRSPAQLEKVLAEIGLDMDLKPYLDQKDAPPTIVEETSNKPRWSSAASAVNDFSGFTKT